MEVEMLQAMFMEDFVLERAGPPAAFRIALFPEGGGGDEGANHVAAELRVSYVPRYPEEPPELALAPMLGLSDALAREAHGMLLAAASDELLGSAMIWSLAERVQAWLRTHNDPPAASAHDEMMRRMAGGPEGGGGNGAADGAGGSADEEGSDGDEAAGGKRKAGAGAEADERRAHASYTPVSPENFAAWRAAFEARSGAVAAEASSKLTGRQLFESGRTLGGPGEGGADDDDGEGEDADYTRRPGDDGEADGGAEAEAGGGGPIDESLFDEEDEEDGE